MAVEILSFTSIKSENMKKTAIITGASGALGRVVTDLFLQCGFKVAGVARNEKELLKIVPGKNPDYLPVAADLTVEAQVKAAFARIREKFSAIDVLVHCAGGFRAGHMVADMETDEWDFMMNLNLKSAFLCAKYAMQAMIPQKNGKIITISALAVNQPGAQKAAYLASKAGLVTLTKALAAEGKAYNIQVNAIAPSIIRTPSNEKGMPDADFSTWVDPRDMAETAVFLSSQQAGGISASVIEMPGGV